MAFTSEPQSFADKAREAWGLSFPLLGDSNNLLSEHLITQGFVPNLFISAGSHLTSAQQFYFRNHPFMQHYRLGCTQPSFTIVYNNRAVALTMAVQPEPRNGMGAAGRPNVSQVWSAFEAVDDQGGTGQISKEALQVQDILDETYVRIVIVTSISLGLLIALWATGALAMSKAATVALAVALVAFTQFRGTYYGRNATALMGGSPVSRMLRLLRFVAAFMMTSISHRLGLGASQQSPPLLSPSGASPQKSAQGRYGCPKEGVPAMKGLPQEVVAAIASRGFHRPHGLERWLALHAVTDPHKACKECIAAMRSG